MSKDRKAWIAAVLGLAYPGVGHLYAGQVRAAVALMAAVPLLAAPLVVAGAVHLPRPLNIIGLWGGLGAVLLVGSLGGGLAANRAPRPFQLGPANRWWLYAGLILLNVFVIGPLSRSAIRSYIAQAFRIPSEAMVPTILPGDYVYVDSDTGSPAPGEIVAFQSVEETGLRVLKRVVAVGGDTLEMRDGHLRRNGELVGEPHAVSTDPAAQADRLSVIKMLAWQSPLLTRDTAGYVPSVRTWGPIVIPQGTFFDLGDNRDASYDSRYYGPVPTANIVGRVQAVYYSYDPASYRPLPQLSSIRWRRLGLILR